MTFNEFTLNWFTFQFRSTEIFAIDIRIARSFLTNMSRRPFHRSIWPTWVHFSMTQRQLNGLGSKRAHLPFDLIQSNYAFFLLFCSIIIDRNAPTFTKVLPKVISTSGRSILNELNPIQRSAVLKALTVNDYLLLKGLPGTGKTQTLTAIIRLHVLMGKSVLITSHTNSAVDNLLLRLMESDPSIKFIRLGSMSRTKAELIEFSESRLTADCRTAEALAAVYSSYVS